MAAFDESDARLTMENAILAAARNTGLFVDAALVFPNIFKDPGDVLRLEVEHVDADPDVISLDGTVHRERGIYQATVIAAKGRGQAPAREAAQALKSEFTFGASYPVLSGGQVQIPSTPVIEAGYADDTSWRVPVLIQYLASG